MDYTDKTYTVTFPAGQTTATFNVSITDDNMLETDENFMLTINLSISDNVFIGNPDQTTVTIVDNECK